MGVFILYVLEGLLGFLEVVIIASAVMSWLVAFNVINTRNTAVRQIEHMLWAISRPVLWPIRRVIPALGSVDISPIIALLIIEGARKALLPWLFAPVIAALGG
jgi:YggT family protein